MANRVLLKLNLKVEYTKCNIFAIIRGTLEMVSKTHVVPRGTRDTKQKRRYVNRYTFEILSNTKLNRNLKDFDP